MGVLLEAMRTRPVDRTHGVANYRTQLENKEKERGKRERVASNQIDGGNPMRPNTENKRNSLKRRRRYIGQDETRDIGRPVNQLSQSLSPPRSSVLVVVGAKAGGCIHSDSGQLLPVLYIETETVGAAAHYSPDQVVSSTRPTTLDIAF